MATASCSFLQLSFSKNPNLPYLSPTRPSILPIKSSRKAFPCPSSRIGLLALPCTAAAAAGPIDQTELAVNPALRNANLLFFRSGYNVQVFVEEQEPEEVLLRRFRREVSKAGVIQECKRRRYFENKHDEKKRKAQEAGRRNRRRKLGRRFTSSSLSSSTTSSPSSTDSADSSKKPGEDKDDNWDMPAGDLPY